MEEKKKISEEIKITILQSNQCSEIIRLLMTDVALETGASINRIDNGNNCTLIFGIKKEDFESQEYYEQRIKKTKVIIKLYLSDLYFVFNNKVYNPSTAKDDFLPVDSPDDDIETMFSANNTEENSAKKV